MALEDADLLDDADSGSKVSLVSCSICLEAVTDDGDRSWAKLQCGHQFHLDCIGSAFNVKGAMQCPNCRNTEKGQWLYPNGSRSLSEFNMDDWTHDEDLYDLGYSETSFGVHWCPFTGLSRFPSSFDEGDFSSTSYHDLLGQHAIFAEHSAISSAARRSPYVTFVHHPSSSNSGGGSVPDGSSFNSHWNGLSVPSEMPASYAFGGIDIHYHSWEHHSTPFPTPSISRVTEQPPSLPPVAHMATRVSSDVPRPGNYMHQFLVGHGSGGGGGSGRGSSSSVVSSMVVPPYPGSVARARDRVQALQAYFEHPPSSNSAVSMRMPVNSSATTRRSSSQREVMGHIAASSSSHQSRRADGGLYPVHEADTTPPMSSNPFPVEGREQHYYMMTPPFSLSQTERSHPAEWQVPHHEVGSDVAAASAAIIRSSTIFRPRHGSERLPSHNQL